MSAKPDLTTPKQLQTRSRSGGTIALSGISASRRLLAALVMPSLFGGLVWWGLHAGLYSAHVGTTIFVVGSVAILIAVIVWTTSTLERADRERRKAIEELRARARQEAAIADLGRAVLAGGDLDALMKEAVVAVAECLKVEYAKILELDRSGGALLLRAGVGWKEGLVGHATVGAGRDSQAGFTLLSGEPVIVEDLRTETRFTGPALLHEHGVVSGLSVIIPGPLRPFGVLGAHTKSSREFSSHDVHFLQDVAHLLTVTIERQRAEEALRRQSRMHEAFFDQAVICFALLDPQYNFIRVNEAYAKACRRKVEDFPGRNHFELFPSDAKRIFDEVIRTRQPFQTAARPFTFEDQPGRGVTYWDWTLVPVLDDKGELEFLVFALNEVTERKLAEDALQRASAYHRSLIEASLDPLVTIAPDGKITDVNNATEKVTGFSRQELIGTDFSAYFTEPERAQAGYLQVFREGWVQDYELAVRHRGGHVTPVLYNATVYRDAGGQVVGVFAAARDVSERKHAEQELRRLNRALRTISECNEVIVRAREERELLYGVCGILVKEGGYRMAWVGYAEQDPGKTVRPVASAGVEDDYLESVQITWADTERGRGPSGRAIRTGEPSIARNTQQDPDFAPWREEARRRGFASSIALPLTLNDRTLGALMLYSQFVDAFDEAEVRLLTELAQDLAFGVQALRTRADRKRGEVELRQLSARLLQLRDQEQRRIARELHDSTGQNLAALAMNLGWIDQQATSLDPGTRAVLAESSEIIKRCTQEIRDFAYLLHPPTLDDYGLASGLRWYAEGFARRSGIRVTLDVPEDLRRLPGDVETALFRVVQECLTNVHRHSGSSTVRIRILQEENNLSLEIADEGRGFQVPGRDAPFGVQRMGVGVLGMRERLRDLGGRLEIDSNSHGTTVRACLPLEEKAA